MPDFDPNSAFLGANDSSNQHQPQQVGVINWQGLTQPSQAEQPKTIGHSQPSSQGISAGNDIGSGIGDLIGGLKKLFAPQASSTMPSSGTGQNVLQQSLGGSNISSPGNVTNLMSTAQQYTGMNSSSNALKAALQKSNPGLDPSQTPWCAGFVGSVLNANGIKGTGSLAAKSYLNFGTPTNNPQKGDLVVYNDLTGRNDPAHGHIGFVDHIDQKTGQVYTLGGNQGGQVSLKAYPISAVAGFRQVPTGDQIQKFSQSKGINDPNQLTTLPQQVHNSMQQKRQSQQYQTPLTPQSQSQIAPSQQFMPQNASPELPHVMSAISQNETGGSQNPYQSVTKAGKGDSAYGKYQIMGNNIPAWTHEATGTPMTPKQFMNNPAAQEKTAAFKINQYVQKYGPSGAARAWFGGEQGMKNDNAKDKSGMTVKGYEQKFNENYLKSKNGMSLNDHGTVGQSPGSPSAPNQMPAPYAPGLPPLHTASNQRFEDPYGNTIDSDDESGSSPQIQRDQAKTDANVDQRTNMPILTRPNNDRTIDPNQVGDLPYQNQQDYKGNDLRTKQAAQDQVDWQALINSKIS